MSTTEKGMLITIAVLLICIIVASPRVSKGIRDGIKSLTEQKK